MHIEEVETGLREGRKSLSGLYDLHFKIKAVFLLVEKQWRRVIEVMENLNPKKNNCVSKWLQSLSNSHSNCLSPLLDGPH